jgi:uncharacterized protein
VEIEYDDAKDEANRAKHGLSLDKADSFDFETALIAEDTRRNYGEARFRALGLIDDRVHALVFTMRGDMLRVISLRKANARETRLYENDKDS